MAEHKVGWPLAKYRRPDPWAGECAGGRRWPDAVLERAPRLCSVDLRDGNQALPTPLNPQAKLAYFDLLVRCGFTEIEIGFPAASRDDAVSCQQLIASGAIPASVTPQVLTTAHPHLINTTFDAVAGAAAMRIHFFHTISPHQCAVVFGDEFRGAPWVAQAAALACKRRVQDDAVGALSIEYSPESFTQAPLSDAKDACAAVLNVLQPTPQRPLVINFPATVEVCGPHRFADAIEAMVDYLPNDGSVVVSVHPHNDRGTAVAAAELSVLAGAQRVEGCLFGHGERAGNVCLLTVAMNLVAQGIDPGVYFPHIDDVADNVAALTGIAVGERHPYAGRLTFTALAGTHQDAIDKALRHEQEHGPAPVWDVPYLPIDPRDLGRSLDTVIELSDQSGKSGVGHVVRREFGIDVAPEMRRAWGRVLAERRAASPTTCTPVVVGLALEQASSVASSLPWGAPGLWVGVEEARLYTAPGDLPTVVGVDDIPVWVSSRRHGSVQQFVACAQAAPGEEELMGGWRLAIAATAHEAVGLVTSVVDQAQWESARIP